MRISRTVMDYCSGNQVEIDYDLVDTRSSEQKQDCKLTVVCLAYNHISYIEECVRSLLDQSTNFNYKIVVHDDASNDGTRNVLENLQRNNEGRLVLISEKANIYSQGLKWRDVVSPYIEGEYVALCEGDDWWISESKLQDQYDYMISAPNASLCVCGGLLFDDKSKKYVGRNAPSVIERDFSTDEIVLGDGGLFLTNSMLIRRDCLLLPRVFSDWGVGDYPQCIFCSTIGTVHYLPGDYSAYRQMSSGSWSTRTVSKEKRLREYERLHRGLSAFNLSTDFAYDESVSSFLKWKKFEVLAETGDWSFLKSNIPAEDYKELSFAQRVKGWVRCNVPIAYSVIKTARNGLLSRKIRKSELG